MNWIYYLSRMEKKLRNLERKIQITRETFGYYIQNFRSPIFISLTTAPPKERGGRNSIFRIVKHALWTTSKYPSTYLLLAYFRFLFEPERRSAHKRIERSTKGYNIRGDGKEHAERAEFNHISIWRTFLPFLFTTPHPKLPLFLSTDKVVQSPSKHLRGCGPLHATPWNYFNEPAPVWLEI